MDDLVDRVGMAYRYFKENNQRYEESRKFVFDTTLTEELRSTLINIGWPIFEVNTLESFISRLCGEFAKQIPSPAIRATQRKSNDPKTIQLVQMLEGRLRYIFESARADNAKKAIYTEQLSGGFSAARVVVDYINPLSMDQDVWFEKCYDPTLAYFDPIARENHKGDGRFCGELIPMTEEEFKHEFPDVPVDAIDYTRDALTDGNLHWYYQEGEDSTLRKIIYIADHYEKKEVEEKLVEVKIPNLKPLIQKVMQAAKQFIAMKKMQQQQQAQQQQQGAQSPSGTPQGQMPPQGMQQQQPSQMPMNPQMAQRGSSQAPEQMGQQQPGGSPSTQPGSEQFKPFIMKTMTEEVYEAFSEMWKEKTMLPVPKIIRRRTTTVCEIWHYRFTRDRLLTRPKKTNFPVLPIIFFDGNSHVLENKQMTRPYHYQAMDAQKMKNICAIAIMNSIENMPQTRLLMAKGSIPEEPAYQETWKNPQKPSAAMIYNETSEVNDGGKPLPPPAPLNLAYNIQELLGLYSELDKTVQLILGNFDQQLGIQQKDLSGIAIQEGATQSNNAAMPYINNYMDSLNQISSCIVQMIPKLVKTPRTMSIINADGLHEAILLNDPDNDITMLDYNGMDLEVVVKASVNFDIQKGRTFQNLATLMGLPDPNPWKAFFGGPAATDLLDNMTIRNQDALKQKFIDFLVDQEKQQQQQAELAIMTNPATVQMMDIQSRQEIKQQELQLKQIDQKITQQIEGMKVLETFIKSIADLRESSARMAIQKSQIEAENNRTNSEGATKALDAAMSIDAHISAQEDKKMENLYRQIELGNQLRETDIKQGALLNKSASQQLQSLGEKNNG